MTLSIVIMAAGKGTRMKSNRPKVLHTLAGRPLLSHVLSTANALRPDTLVVVTGHGADLVERYVTHAAPQAQCVLQMPQRGTGHAVQQALPALPESGIVLILNGDVPLISGATAQRLVEACAGRTLALLTLALPDPTGYGRIVRSATGTIEGVIEHKDATDEQRAFQEIYTGVMAAPAAWLRSAVQALRDDNAQGEFYLTDVVATAVADGLEVRSTHPADATEVLGVNSPAQLADLERRYQQQLASALMEAGVRLADPQRIDIRGELVCGTDVEIDVNCIFEGSVRLGEGVRVGSHCVLRNVTLSAGVVIHPFTHIDGDTQGVVVGDGSLIGPFARLRPGATLGAGVHIGNFVEVKNSTLGDGAKANHLAYLGDASVGPHVNYGAGSITANYDGANKHRTTIETGAHIGSNCVLVAPITVGAGATIGAGSTVSQDAPAHRLTVARAKAVTLNHWKRPTKKTE